VLKGIVESGFRSRSDSQKLIAALEQLNVPASQGFPSGALRIRKSDHQGSMPEYIAVIEDGKERVKSVISTDEVEKID
jgi:hypothetical protein